VALGRLDRGLHDARMVRETQVIVAAERHHFAPFDHDMRALGAFKYAAVAPQAACIEHGELGGQIGV
jgi:hypothetical protein